LIRRRRTLNIQYSIENIQSFEDGENISLDKSFANMMGFE